MFKNSADVKKYHKRFIRDVVRSEIVWGLHSDDGWATSSANNFENEEGQPEKLICFWSDEKRAGVCQKKFWQEFTPKQIPLTEFMENWLVGMDQDGAIVGTNFDWNLFGFEALPLELLIELFQELKRSDKSLKFLKYENQDEFERLVQEILSTYKR